MSSKLKSDVNQLDDLVKDLLNEVNRPVNNDNPSHQRSKTTREERIRVKRGDGGIEIPVTTTSSSTTSTTTIKPQISSSSSVDEHLIDSLLESVQNTLRKRAQRNQSNWTTDIPIHNRRAYSSSAAYTDSIHRMDPSRGRFPIKLNRTDSPTSTLSSRRPYSRHDSRDGYISSSTTTTIPTHFRATSEPPPDGPIELRRMDLICSPTRTYIHSHSTLPSRGFRGRGHDHSGYETDTGLMMSRAHRPRYYPVPPPPPPMYPYYRQHESHRSMFRPDGYDTDSGLISSGRLHMTRTMPPRMAVIPETVIVNNRMVSSTNLNTMPTTLRNSSFLNQTNRSENLAGYETDSGMNTRQYHSGYRQIPVNIQTGNDQHYHQTHSTSIPVYTHHPEQQKRTTDTNKKNISILPIIYPSTVGLSNPLSDNNYQQQRIFESEIKHKISNDNAPKRLARPHGAIIESTVLQSAINPGVTKSEIFSEIVPNTNVDNQTTHISSTTSTFPTVNQTYNTNVSTRVGNSSYRNQDETSRRSSISSTAESDVFRNGAYQAHNISQFWYKEKMSREDAINILKSKPPGTFLVRDSQGFPGSFGLAVRVETLPPGIQSKPGADPTAELVRHYLIERTPTGHVRLKGCSNEPDFANLSALVYQHTLTSFALPIKLVLPTNDFTEGYRSIINQQQEAKKMSVKDLLEKGAVCNVIYLNNVDVESLSGQVAVSKALQHTFDNAEQLQATIVNFKVSSTGITLTDTKKKLFSRRHFPKEYVTYCGVDYDTNRFWTYQYNDLEMLPRAKCFGFVSKKINGPQSSQPENECHIFAEVDPSQSSTAIVNFVSKVMIGSIPV